VRKPSVVCAATFLALSAFAAEAPKVRRYYAYPGVEDRFGVIAPWYKGQNGQCDFRVRVAAETLKRYPWVEKDKCVAPGPHFIFNGQWRIAADGKISVPPCNDWDNGDLGQRAAYILSSLVEYYRYSGDAAAIGIITLTADFLLDHCQTPDDHPWPRFLISCPVKGKAYGKCDPRGFIQLDIVAEVGSALLRAYMLAGGEGEAPAEPRARTGDGSAGASPSRAGGKRWLEAAKHWGDLLAEKRNPDPAKPPWGRYANPEDVRWKDTQMTGGVAFLLDFFDLLIRLGHKGKDDAIVKARDAGRRFLAETLLPKWTVDDTWGRNYWDWNDPVQAENVTEWVANYLMDNPDVFPNWRNDVRNILSLFLHRTSVSPASVGGVYSGAWAYPESSSCCGRSLWYGPMELAGTWAKYAALAGSEWAREIARRQILLATYDAHETGVVEDNIDGGAIVAGAWFKIAHPMALKHTLAAMAWLPDILGASRENHIMRTTSVVRQVGYYRGLIGYHAFDAPAPCVDVLRLAFSPQSVEADGKPLSLQKELSANGYHLKPLGNGDYIVTIRRDGCRQVSIKGDDPQQLAQHDRLKYEGEWIGEDEGPYFARTQGASASLTFTGNQVRLMGRVGPGSGIADVYLDGTKQLAGIDSWCPEFRGEEVLYYKNGLKPGPHTLKVVALGASNPLPKDDKRVWVENVYWSAAEGDSGFGEGGGPKEAQRVVFGYTGRTDLVDSGDNAWRPATEWTILLGNGADAVARAWWTAPRAEKIEGTKDPELYRYGAHGRDFTAWFTVGPGTYHARIKLAETREAEPRLRVMTIELNGQPVAKHLDIAATAGGLRKATDLVFDNIEPKNGCIALRFRNRFGGEAIVQAIEIGPGPGGEGAKPICLPPPDAEAGNLLVNPGFEEGVAGVVGSNGSTGGGMGWEYVFRGKKQSYVWGETGFKIHPQWGPPKPRTGKEALRTHTDADGHNVVWQDVEVAPNAKYRASAWVKAADLHGKGFGTGKADSAGIIIEELDEKGKAILTHPKAALAKPGDYAEVATTFTTSPKTVTIRFILDTLIAAKYDEGHVTYDDCALERQK